jgi:nitronate monooxygenase
VEIVNMSGGIGQRVESFCRRFELGAPILLAPMAGVPAPALSIAVAAGGGLGACGVVLMSPAEITAWADTVRPHGAFQLNNWIPELPPRRDVAAESAVREFLAAWGPAVAAEAGDARPPDFPAQCEAMLAAAPRAISSVMGLFPAAYVKRLQRAGIAWFAAVSTVSEARAAEAAGADVLVVQGMEAGGHRASFDAALAEVQQVGLFALLPAVVSAVRLPVVATGGIADGRGVAAALLLGASAVQIGSAFLRSPEAGIPAEWAQALAKAAPEDTVLTRAFSGRPGRSLATEYVRAAAAPAAPPPAPYPVQRGLTAAMRQAASRSGDLQRMQAWAGQSAALAQPAPAVAMVQALWRGARELLSTAAF